MGLRHQMWDGAVSLTEVATFVLELTLVDS